MELNIKLKKTGDHSLAIGSIARRMRRESAFAPISGTSVANLMRVADKNGSNS
jgi:hypothetical protein